MIEFSITHSEESVRQAYRSYWQHHYGTPYRVSMVLAVIALVFVFGLQEVHWSLYAVLVVLVLFAAMLIAMRDTAVKMALQQYRLLKRPDLHYRLSDVGLWEKSGIGACELHWNVFEHCLETRGFLYIVRKPQDAGQFLAFPAEQVPEEARAFIRGKLAVKS